MHIRALISLDLYLMCLRKVVGLEVANQLQPSVARLLTQEAAVGGTTGLVVSYPLCCSGMECFVGYQTVMMS